MLKMLAINSSGLFSAEENECPPQYFRVERLYYFSTLHKPVILRLVKSTSCPFIASYFIFDSIANPTEIEERRENKRLAI